MVAEHQGKEFPGEHLTLIKWPVDEHLAGHPLRQRQTHSLREGAPQAGMQSRQIPIWLAAALPHEQTPGSGGILVHNGALHRRRISLQHG
jgi:hypothetical protein